MAFREFDDLNLSRRNLLRGSAMLGASALLTTYPGTALLARERSPWPSVASMIQSYVTEGKVANMVATLGWGQKLPESIAQGRLGFGDKPVAGLDSLYRIYSMTKPITGMAAMMLIDEGKLGLDQPLPEILPEFATMRVLKDPKSPLTDTVPAERPITIRQLLTHTAGLGYSLPGVGDTAVDLAYGRYGVSSGQVSRLPIPGVADVESLRGLASWAEALARLPLVYQPGARWRYSASIDLLGRVIEVVGKQRLDTFLQTRLFDPLGMDSTFFRVPASERGRLTDNFGILGGVPIPIDSGRSSIFLEQPPVFWGGSGLVSSPRDYDRFQRMLLGYGMFEGKRVMSEAAVRLGTSNLLPKTAQSSGTWIAGQGFGAGGRSVNSTFGWGGAAGTLASVDFANDLRGALFVQYMPDSTYPIRQEFLAAVARDLQAMADA